MADVEHSVPRSDKKKTKTKTKTKKNKRLEDNEIETIQNDTESKPRSFTPSIDTSQWPIILKNYDRLNVRTAHCAPLSSGFGPLKRPLPEFIRFGIINLDNPPNSPSGVVPARTKRILRVQKTGHSETLDPKVSGNLNVCIEEIECVCTARFHSAVPDVAKIARALETLNDHVFQRPPLISAVRYIYKSKLVEYDADKHLVVFRITCEAGTYVSTLCVHLGLLLGVGGQMQKLRKARSSTEPVNSEEQDDDSLIASLAASTESLNSEEQDDDSLIASLAASTEPVKWDDMVMEEEKKNKLIAEHGKPNEKALSKNVPHPEVSDSLIASLDASTEPVNSEEQDDDSLIPSLAASTESVNSEEQDDDSLIASLAASTEPISWEDMVEEEEEKNKLIAEHGKPNENTPSECIDKLYLVQLSYV